MIEMTGSNSIGDMFYGGAIAMICASLFEFAVSDPLRGSLAAGVALMLLILSWNAAD